MKDILVLLIILVLPLVVFFTADGGLIDICDFFWDKHRYRHYKKITNRQGATSVDVVALHKEFRKVDCKPVYFELIRMYIYSYFRYHKHFSLNDFSCFVDALQNETDKYFAAHPPMKDAYYLIESCTFREALLKALDQPFIHDKSSIYPLLKKMEGYDAEEYVRYLYDLTKDDYKKKPLGDWTKDELFHLLHIEYMLLGEESRLFQQDVPYKERFHQ